MVITSKNNKLEVDQVPTVEEKEPAGVAQTTTDVKDVTFTSSVSEQKQRRPTNPSKGETKTCSNWQKKGRCKKGDQCRFSHEGEIFIKKQNNKKETKKQTTKIDISTTTKEEKAEEDEKHTENNKSKHTMSKETKTKVYYDTEGKELDARFHTTQEHLSDQDLRKLDITTLNPLSPEVISRQATINVGTIGHVAHGKSTVVKSISGVQTVRFKNELERNITIKLGYANAKIYKRIDGKEGPGNYCSKGSHEPDTFTDEQGSWKLDRHISFVDCPGHDILMATMLNGAAVMDAALLLVAGNETCPQPQTSEHLAAVEIMRLNNIIILQNKVDLVKPEAAQQQQEEIRKFVAGTVAGDAPIIPISAVLKYNLDIVCEYLCKTVKVPKRDFTCSPRMIVIRSFDVNKPGADVESLQGGVAGGSIMQGVLKVGDEIEVRPGIVQKDAEGKYTVRPIFSKIVSLYAEKNDLMFAVPGGLIGVGTVIDPTLTRADRLVGQVLGLKGKLPEVFIEVEISFYLLRRLLGVKAADGSKGAKVQKLSKSEILLVNIGSTSTGGKVLAMKKDMAKLALMQPVCTQQGEKIALSRRVDKHWRLIGWGQINRGVMIECKNE